MAGKLGTVKKEKDFHKVIRFWVRLEESCDIEAFKFQNTHKYWTAEEKYE